MLFKKINCRKYKKGFVAIIFLMLFTFILTISDCTSTYRYKVDSDKIGSKTEYELINVIMNDGLVIDLRGQNAAYQKTFGDKNNVIIVNRTDTNFITKDHYTISNKVQVIELKDAKSITIEKSETNTGATILTVLGVIAGLAVLVYIIVIAGKSSCPFIYSYDGEKYVFDAEPYGGAITEGLKKTDYSRLENLKPSDGKYKLLIRNEADETQHTDEIKLLAINHPENTKVAPDINGNMTIFQNVTEPSSVTDENGKNITRFFKTKDNIQWQSEFPNDTSLTGKNLKHELILKFPKPKDAKNVKLIINAGTALWGGYMIKEMLNLRGKKVDEWYQNVDNKGIELMKLYQFMEREELYSLKIYVNENGKWNEKNYLTAGGPFIDEDKIVDLNIENVQGDTLYIKLNPPIGYWKIDYVGMIYDYKSSPEINEYPASYAMDNNNTDLRKILSSTDGKYYDMFDTTYSADIHFDLPPSPKNGYIRSLFLKTTGYYDIHLKKDKPEQAEFIKQIYDTPGLILEYSLKKYIEKINSLGFSQ